MWQQILFLFLAGISLYFMYRSIKGRPDLFNKTNLSHSALTLGGLGILLILFVGLLVFIAK